MIVAIKNGCLAAIVLSYITLSLTVLGPVQAHSSAWPTITRSEHILNVRHDILPKGYNSPLPLTKRSIDNSVPPETVRLDDTLRLTFNAYNTTFHLHLEPNLDLIHPDVDWGNAAFSKDDIKAFKGVVVRDEFHSDQKWDRAARTSRAEKRSVEHMLYEEGVLGWARITVQHDPENEDSDLYNRPSNLAKRKRGLEESSCGADSLLTRQAADATAPLQHEYYYPPNQTATIPMTGGSASDYSSSWTGLFNKSPMIKRGLEIRAAGPDPVPEGCPVNRLVTYMGVAADCTYVRSYKGVANARQQIFADFNAVSGIYESTFNVALGVIALNIVPENCPTTPVKGEEWNQECSTGYSIDQRLSDFSFWRGQPARSNDGAGLWHLMTKCNSGAVVGIAWTKALCKMDVQAQGSKGKQEYTSGTGVSSISPNEWLVIAHEIGHGFGAVHDCNQQTCPTFSTGGANQQCCPLSSSVCDAGSKYIMNPSESTPTKIFSPCSIKTICGTIKSTAGSCLKPPGTRQTQSSEANICGNGLKENGEECDCGSPEECAKDPCCDGKTCKLKNGAVCDDLNDDCCLDCKLRSAGTVCRKAISECDTEEVCTGVNATCPPDIRIPNQTPCKGTGNDTGLTCANGLCTSRDLQCQQQDRKGITKQCGASSTCDLRCNDPNGGAMSCTQIPGAFFLDGTSCGIGGTCNGGRCEFTGGVDGVINWAKNNLFIAIPIASIVGLVLLCCIWSCCCAGCVNRRSQHQQTYKPHRLNSNGYQYAGFAPPAGNPPPQQYQMGPLPPPPPAYQSGNMYPNGSNNNAANPFGDHNSSQYQNQQQQQQQDRPQQNGYF
ncbi:hypothetical protein BG011_008449 [Mortierella polycephala]|uniref:Zinc metalloprotease n=1 Tax=Mortierella polycephala TaxID=41804 RepID=A0A9P6UA31_9FUNG|nr:hypothetical protein BG011_008449 [Mortierella polycephala]